jgi:heat shock protein HslJ
MPKLPLLLAAIALLASCRTLAASHEVRGTHWDVTRIDSIPASGFISFGDESFDANFGCNSVRGRFRTEGDVLVIGALDKSQMACMAIEEGTDGRQPVSLMQLEDAALVILSGAVRQIWRGENDLILQSSGGEIALSRRGNPPPN